MVDVSERALRRIAGLVLVAAVVVTVLVVAAIQGILEAGHGVAPPITAAPQPGDCVAESPGEVGDETDDWSPAMPFVRLETCTGARFGEVAYVIPDVAATHSSAMPQQDPYSQCVRKTDEYLGIPSGPSPHPDSTGAPPTAEPIFHPAANISTTYFGPDVRARAAGQNWEACVVYLPGSAHLEDVIEAGHSLRGSWSLQADNQLFALCLDRPTTPGAVDCHLPHAFELIGTSVGSPSASSESIDTACRETAVQLLGSAHALDDGALSAQVVAVRPSPYDGALFSGPAAISTSSPYVNKCLLTSTDNDRQLTGPLRGLLDRPVPLS